MFAKKNFTFISLGSLFVLLISYSNLLTNTFAQEDETETSILDPAFRIVNIPNEGIITQDNDTIYKQQLKMHPEDQTLGVSESIEDVGGVSLTSYQKGLFILVADSGTKKVQKFDSNGTLQNEWQSTELGNATFAGDIDLSAAPDDTILVADSGTKKVQKFDSNGTLQNEWQYADRPVLTRQDNEQDENDTFDIAEEIEQDPSIAPQAFTSSSSQSEETKSVISPSSASSSPGEQDGAEREFTYPNAHPPSTSSSSTSSSGSSSTLNPIPSEGNEPNIPPSPSPASSSSSSSSSPPFTP